MNIRPDIYALITTLNLEKVLYLQQFAKPVNDTQPVLPSTTPPPYMAMNPPVECFRNTTIPARKAA